MSNNTIVHPADNNEALTELFAHAQADRTAREHVQTDSEWEIANLVYSFLPPQFHYATDPRATNLWAVSVSGRQVKITVKGTGYSSLDATASAKILDLAALLQSAGVPAIHFCKEVVDTNDDKAPWKDHFYLNMNLEDSAKVTITATKYNSDEVKHVFEDFFESALDFFLHATFGDV